MGERAVRRFQEGQRFLVDGMEFLVQQGSKHPDDLRLLWRIGGRWRPVRMAVGAFLADFFFENEQVLYPPRPDGSGPKGGAKYLDYIRHAARFGWEKAEAGLVAERQVKESRLFSDEEVA